MMGYGIAWLIAVIIFAVVEGFTYQLISIWFAIGAIGAIVTALFGGEFSLQLTVFAILSLVCIIFTRPLFKKTLEHRIERTNADALIGKTALVISDIDNTHGFGTVKINGIEWSAKSIDNDIIKTDSKVIVENIEGVKLIVRKGE